MTEPMTNDLSTMSKLYKPHAFGEPRMWKRTPFEGESNSRRAASEQDRCKHCTETDCEHCQVAEDGCHQIDTRTIRGTTGSDDPDYVCVSVTCGLCEVSGDLEVEVTAVQWDGPVSRGVVTPPSTMGGGTANTSWTTEEVTKLVEDFMDLVAGSRQPVTCPRDGTRLMFRGGRNRLELHCEACDRSECVPWQHLAELAASRHARADAQPRKATSK